MCFFCITAEASEVSLDKAPKNPPNSIFSIRFLKIWKFENLHDCSFLAYLFVYPIKLQYVKLLWINSNNCKIQLITFFNLYDYEFVNFTFAKSYISTNQKINLKCFNSWLTPSEWTILFTKRSHPRFSKTTWILLSSSNLGL